MVGACDTHIHVYDSRYPVAPRALLHSPDASLEDYAEVQSALGTERVVLIQPTTYGLDNSLHLDALAALGDTARGVDSEAFSALLALVDDGAHVKLSAPYESALDPTHRYEAVSACVDALVAHEPDRLLWASNWPHPGQADPPDLEGLTELRGRWLPTGELRRRVMVDNPARLYGF